MNDASGPSPSVSVIIPCYNYARFLSDAVESVLGQTYTDYEIIIVNDGSNDGTSDVARGLISKYPEHNIRLLEQDNSGVSAARNNGFSASRGRYILPLDADDMLKPVLLEKLVPILDSDTDAGLAYSWVETFGDETGITRNGDFTLKNIMVRDAAHQSPLVRRSAWESVGGYKRDMAEGMEDWEFAISLYEAGYKGTVVPEALMMYRKHGRSRLSGEMSSTMELTRRLKLMHPRTFAPHLSRISLPLARAVIRLKSRVRDPLTHYIYVRFPRLHRAFARIKYDVLGFLWRG